MPAPRLFTEALQARAVKTTIAADISSREWRALPAEVRERAAFMARTTNADIVNQFSQFVDTILNPRPGSRINPVTGTPVTEGMNYADADAAAKAFLASMDYRPEPGKEGTIEDLSSDTRIKVKLHTDVEQAQGYGQFVQAQQSLEAYPCQELYRIEDRDKKRDWGQRWTLAAQIADDAKALRGLVVYGRMIATKDSGVWEQLGNVADDSLGTPYPPFAFNSGMWVRNVGRREAIAMDLIGPDTIVQAQTRGFTDDLVMDPGKMAWNLIDSLQASLGPNYYRDADGAFRRNA